jgi:uncharacterized protein YbjQ (UPF0145 family)
MLLTNIERIPGKKITNHIGLVQGSTVRAKHLGKDIGAFFKNLVGGELESYSDLMRESREQAIERMAELAKEKGANGVINIRLTTASISGGAAEMLAYGTAVVLEDA